MLKKTRHPHVLRVLDSCETDAGIYIVTEKVRPLLDWREVCEQPSAYALYQVVDAVSFLHASNTVHGFVDPASLFVTEHGDIRLGGFELAGSSQEMIASSIIHQRRAMSCGVRGWPVPTDLPSGAPAGIVDYFGLAVVAAYVFCSKGRGSDYRLDLNTAQNEVPPGFQSIFKELKNPGQMRDLSKMLQQPFFQNDSTVKVMHFLSNLAIQSDQDKMQFFETLPNMLDDIPSFLQKSQLLKYVLQAFDFPPLAAVALTALVKIGTKLEPDEFNAKVSPMVIKMFAVTDRGVRYRLYYLN